MAAGTAPPSTPLSSHTHAPVPRPQLPTPAAPRRAQQPLLLDPRLVLYQTPLLPIAPLGTLLEGIRSGRATADQLAIGLTDQGGELLMIRGDGRTLSLVDLPDLRL